MVDKVIIHATTDYEERKLSLTEDTITQRRSALIGERASSKGPVEVDEVLQSALNEKLTDFNLLVTKYQDSLYWWVFSLVRDEDLAEDITQSTFITAYEKMKSFRGQSIKAWLSQLLATAASMNCAGRNVIFHSVGRTHLRKTKIEWTFSLITLHYLKKLW